MTPKPKKDVLTDKDRDKDGKPKPVHVLAKQWSRDLGIRPPDEVLRWPHLT